MTNTNGSMPATRALALAAMALEDVARRAPDVPDWCQAAHLVRRLLAEERAKMLNLTDREYQLLRFIEAYTRQAGYPPIYAEIRQAMGWSSNGLVCYHLNRLKTKRRVTWQRGVPRSLRVLERAA